MLESRNATTAAFYQMLMMAVMRPPLSGIDLSLSSNGGNKIFGGLVNMDPTWVGTKTYHVNGGLGPGTFNPESVTGPDMPRFEFQQTRGEYAFINWFDRKWPDAWGQSAGTGSGGFNADNFNNFVTSRAAIDATSEGYSCNTVVSSLGTESGSFSVSMAGFANGTYQVSIAFLTEFRGTGLGAATVNITSPGNAQIDHFYPNTAQYGCHLDTVNVTIVITGVDPVSIGYWHPTIGIPNGTAELTGYAAITSISKA